MSSATQVNMQAAGAVAKNAPLREGEQAKPSASHQSQQGPAGSRRQRHLNWMWGFYTASCYDGRRVDWNGHQNLEHIEHEVVAQAGYIPPGFFEAGPSLPLKFRKPTSPYYLCRVVVNRFTGLLFSSRRHPKIKVKDDPDTEDWLNCFISEVRLWAKMGLARKYGGSMGSVGVGFKVVQGKPVVEVHDPRWCEVEWDVEELQTLARLEKRFTFDKELRDPQTGEWVTAKFWYRRVIDKQFDSVWPAVPVEDNQEPDWDRYQPEEVQHGLGFVPVAWVQNTETSGAIDGDSDCHGIYDLSEQIDALYSQANRGTVANCDPTPVVNTDTDFDGQLNKGSSNALVLEKGGSFSYAELTGDGPKTAVSLAQELRTRALEVARCVLDTNFGGPARSEGEVTANYSTMLEAADDLREQYGEQGVKRLLEMVLKAARQLAVARVVDDPERPGQKRIVKLVVELPPRVDREGDKVTKVDRKLGEGAQVEVVWGRYEEPGLDAAKAAVEAANGAREAGLINQELAVRHVAPYFGVENPAELAEEMEEEAEERRAAMEERMFGGMAGGKKVPGQDEDLEPDDGGAPPFGRKPAAEEEEPPEP